MGAVFDLSYAVLFRIICSRLMTSITAERELVIKRYLSQCLQRNECVHFNSLSVTASHGPYSSTTEAFRLEIQCKSLTWGMLSLSLDFFIKNGSVFFPGHFRKHPQNPLLFILLFILEAIIGSSKTNFFILFFS